MQHKPDKSVQIHPKWRRTDGQKDFLDSLGARKVTAYIGQYIVEHYGVGGQRGNELYKDWHRAYGEYTQFKIDKYKSPDCHQALSDAAE